MSTERTLADPKMKNARCTSLFKDTVCCVQVVCVDAKHCVFFLSPQKSAVIYKNPISSETSLNKIRQFN